jgi:hypothetical protein
MAKKKIQNQPNIELYVPKLDTKIYVYIQKIPNKLTPIPYTWKSNFESLKKLINESDGIYSK